MTGEEHSRWDLRYIYIYIHTKYPQNAWHDCTILVDMNATCFVVSCALWQDYLANPVTVDSAYSVLIDHALAERDRRYLTTLSWICLCIFIFQVVGVSFVRRIFSSLGENLYVLSQEYLSQFSSHFFDFSVVFLNSPPVITKCVALLKKYLFR